MLALGQLFLGLVFLCTTVADNIHAIKMLQGNHNESQSVQAPQQIKMAISEHAPCHEPMMMHDGASTPKQDQADHPNDKQPCCPYKQCSPNNCLVHFAFVEQSVFEIFPHSPIDSRTFTDIGIHPVAVPFIERLRPPIA